MDQHEHKAQWFSTDRSLQCYVQRCRCGAKRTKAFENRFWTEWV